MVYKYLKPKLNGHKILYKTHKFCLFEVDEEHPYEGYEERCQIVLFDGLLGYVVSSVKLMDGVFKGTIDQAHIHYSFKANTPVEYVWKYKRLYSDYMRTCYGSSRSPLAIFVQMR